MMAHMPTHLQASPPRVSSSNEIDHNRLLVHHDFNAEATCEDLNFQGCTSGSNTGHATGKRDIASDFSCRKVSTTSDHRGSTPPRHSRPSRCPSAPPLANKGRKARF